jgi:ABC-type Mn2+/Zn2+ transport system ATPase subunit
MIEIKDLSLFMPTVQGGGRHRLVPFQTPEHAVIGANGAGKTSLLLALVGRTALTRAGAARLTVYIIKKNGQ